MRIDGAAGSWSWVNQFEDLIIRDFNPTYWISIPIILPCDAHCGCHSEVHPHPWTMYNAVWRTTRSAHISWHGILVKIHFHWPLPYQARRAQEITHVPVVCMRNTDQEMITMTNSGSGREKEIDNLLASCYNWGDQIPHAIVPFLSLFPPHFIHPPIRFSFRLPSYRQQAVSTTEHVRSKYILALALPNPFWTSPIHWSWRSLNLDLVSIPDMGLQTVPTCLLHLETSCPCLSLFWR